MSLLSIVQDVSAVIGLSRPLAVVASTEREHFELLTLANEMAERIGEAHDWQALKKIHTITGDGTTKAHDLPLDYDRMPITAQLWNTSTETPLAQIMDVDQWLHLEIENFTQWTGAWIIYGNQIHTLPAIADGIEVKFFHVKPTYLDPLTNTSKKSFEADTDEFLLKDRLLKLGMIWQWRANKGLPYAEDMENYETALAKDIMSDGGPKIIEVGRQRLSGDVDTAYPHAIVVP